MYCLKCGKQLPDDARFCMHCGAAIPEPAKVQQPAGVTTGTSYSYVPPKTIARDVIRESAPPRTEVQPDPRPEPKPQPKPEPERFCANCGRKMQPQDQFCLNCGHRAGAAVPRTSRSAPKNPQPVKQKKSKKWTIGWVLIVIQLIGMPMSVSDGTLSEMMAEGGVLGFAQLLGFFLPAIIGVCLIMKERKK